jgi:hypothetical protein
LGGIVHDVPILALTCWLVAGAAALQAVQVSSGVDRPPLEASKGFGHHWQDQAFIAGTVASVDCQVLITRLPPGYKVLPDGIKHACGTSTTDQFSRLKEAVC